MNVTKFHEELNQFLDTSGVSQNALARGTGVPQSQISDWKKEVPKRFGKNPKKVMRFIENYRKSDEEPFPEELITVVRSFCEGDNDKYTFLIAIIKSLHPLVNRPREN